MYTNFIFDMDGVLIDSERFYYERRTNYVLEKGITPESQQLHDYIGLTDEQIWIKLVPDAEIRQHIKHSYQEYYRQNPTDFTELLRPEVPALFHFLKSMGKKIGIASSSRRSVIERFLSDCSLGDSVDFYLSGEDVPISKPHPQIYQEVHKMLGAERPAIAIEDSPVGIQAAKAAGLHTVALIQDFEVNQQQADKQISNLNELAKYV